MCCSCTGWQQRGLLPQRLKLQLGCPVPSRAERRGCMRSGQVLLQLRRCLLLLVLVLPVLETAAAWCACTCCMRCAWLPTEPGGVPEPPAARAAICCCLWSIAAICLVSSALSMSYACLAEQNLMSVILPMDFWPPVRSTWS